MSNFDLSSLALASAFPTNKILTDDKGLPSVMVYIPKFKMSDVIDGAGDSTHPAFIVNGVEKDGIPTPAGGGKAPIRQRTNFNTGCDRSAGNPENGIT